MSSAKQILEGKPLRSPIHPALVHLPIALFPLSMVLDVASWIFHRPDLEMVRAAFIAIAAGVGTALFAAIFGFVDYTTIRRDHRAKKTATLHMVLNLIAVGVFSASLALRYGSLDAGRTDILPLLVSIVGLGLIGYSGYLGGDMVYNDGVGVGRHRHQGELPHETIPVSSPNAGDAPVPVADLQSLTEGQTARVDASGTIIAVARSQGKFCAFQEVCTHRYGPLSEGKIENGQVVCPWHGSRFDTKSGKVTRGPAKVDLRTFPIEEKEDEVRLRVTADATQKSTSGGA
jgi:uncharacterized membrane protein/nitrite reductase/ring-hydroxylating ferredoxin subunit